ncbi:MAG: HAD family acid phosphatase [Deltaproteobacteria bacterium]|nr:HAD family acid phosphatase [Deltaproteobacteria bacterium]
MIAFIDIDGVVADARRRRERMLALHGNKRDDAAWATFHEGAEKDPVIPGGFLLVRGLMESQVDVFFLTARAESQRSVTAHWLAANGLGDYEHLIMRPHGDRRPGVEFKTEIVKREVADLPSIYYINDCRPTVIAVDDDPRITAAYDALKMGIYTMTIGGYSDKGINAL